MKKNVDPEKKELHILYFKVAKWKKLNFLKPPI